MLLINNNEIDLGKSFEKLKETLKVGSDKVKEYGYSPEGYAYAYGLLSGSIKGHIITCTDADGKELQDYIDGKEDDPNDLKNVNI
jgi:hypothetical protein